MYLVLFCVSGVESGLFEKGQKLCVLCLVVSASCEDVRMQDNKCKGRASRKPRIVSYEQEDGI